MNTDILNTSCEILSKLISFDTTSRNSNLGIVDWIEGYLADIGVQSTIVRDEKMDKANLYATIGPKDKPGIMLSGHLDVVPVDGQEWSSDPFDLISRDDKLFGRSTCDMKGFIAICLA